MKKRIVSILACIFVLADVSADSIPEFPFIAVDGVAEVDAPISAATITFTVFAHGKAGDEAANAVSSATSSILKELMGVGVLQESITSYDISKKPVRRTVDNSMELEVLGYDVQRNVTVEVSSIATYVPIARVLVRADKVVSVRSAFRIADEEVLRQEAFAKAFSVARQRADALAKASGTVVEKVHAISDHGFSSLGERFLFGGWNTGVLSSPPPGVEEPLFTPDRLSFSCSVSVLFVVRQTNE